MARIRQISASDLLFVGPVGNRACNTAHNSEAVSGNILSAISGDNFVEQLFRVQSCNYSYNKSLTDVNQFGELASIDRVPLNAPTVNLSFSYLLSNLINEGLMGLTVNQSGDTSQVSCISGILNNQTDSRNYFIKTVSEGNDAARFNPSSYNVISLGNCYLESYTSQGAVNSFPTVDVTVSALNIQAQNVTHASGAVIPAIEPTDGSQINFGYILPTGTSNYLNYNVNANDNSQSVIRPGDITLNLNLSDGDSFFQESDLKIQSYNINFSLNREDIGRLGSKYYIKKVPTFPIQVSMEVSAVCGELSTGNLVHIITDNKNFNPSITLKKSNSNTILAYYQLKNAKLENQDVASSIGQNKLVDFRFSATVGSAQSNQGLFMSGVTFSNSVSSEDWGDLSAFSESQDWGLVTEVPPASSDNWGSII